MDLHNAYAKRKAKQRQPFGHGQASAKHEYREGRGGQDLHLVGHLECSDIEIGGRNELEVVLYDVENRRYGKLPTVSADDFPSQLFCPPRPQPYIEGR